MFYDLLLNSLIFILPSYVANGSPVLAAKFIHNRHPIDFGKNFWDGRRILGDGKSIEGFIVGVLAGTLTSLVLQLVGLHSIEEGFILSLGTMLGDSLGSFIKRRLGIERGGKAPVLDQLTFLVVALGLYCLFFKPIPPIKIIILLLVTLFLHRFTNIIAFKLGLKSRPW